MFFASFFQIFNPCFSLFDLFSVSKSFFPFFLPRIPVFFLFYCFSVSKFFFLSFWNPRFFLFHYISVSTFSFFLSLSFSFYWIPVLMFLILLFHVCFFLSFFLTIFFFILSKENTAPPTFGFNWLTRLRFINSLVKVNLHKASTKSFFHFLCPFHFSESTVLLGEVHSVWPPLYLKTQKSWVFRFLLDHSNDSKNHKRHI